MFAANIDRLSMEFAGGGGGVGYAQGCGVDEEAGVRVADEVVGLVSREETLGAGEGRLVAAQAAIARTVVSAPMARDRLRILAMIRVRTVSLPSFVYQVVRGKSCDGYKVTPQRWGRRP